MQFLRCVRHFGDVLPSRVNGGRICCMDACYVPFPFAAGYRVELFYLRPYHYAAAGVTHT